MRKLITIIIAVGMGVAVWCFARSRKGKSKMSFRELYEDNFCGEMGGLFD